MSSVRRRYNRLAAICQLSPHSHTGQPNHAIAAPSLIALSTPPRYTISVMVVRIPHAHMRPHPARLPAHPPPIPRPTHSQTQRAASAQESQEIAPRYLRVACTLHMGLAAGERPHQYRESYSRTRMLRTSEPTRAGSGASSSRSVKGWPAGWNQASLCDASPLIILMTACARTRDGVVLAGNRTWGRPLVNARQAGPPASATPTLKCRRRTLMTRLPQ